eukprot:CAMPEP_0201941612 /NCGR_PEP_ID=MMETSP0903-20130614/47457_1 /ASSEMBLY_ACC=CAM_ASM_000552 /TAXON_ID=420261 /ORGANISM="Thalassiosira antarctica, Strain CCMP982" /LENGTH=1170 /DNA_ID=CAMNT_0048483737 /DNA_START=178 /DNA_END=3693 /DNA_ORIENTATION=-
MPSPIEQQEGITTPRSTSPPETYASDVSSEQSLSSSDEPALLEENGVVLVTEEASLEVVHDSVPRRPDPPSRSNSIVNAEEEQTASSTPSSSLTSIEPPSSFPSSSIPPPPAASSSLPPSSFLRMTADPDGAKTDVEPPYSTNSYVDKPPAGMASKEIRSSTSNTTPSSLFVPPPPHHPYFIPNHAHSDSIISVPLPDFNSPINTIKKDMETMMDEPPGSDDEQQEQQQPQSPTTMAYSSVGATLTDKSGEFAVLAADILNAENTTTSPPSTPTLNHEEEVVVDSNTLNAMHDEMVLDDESVGGGDDEQALTGKVEERDVAQDESLTEATTPPPLHDEKKEGDSTGTPTTIASNGTTPTTPSNILPHLDASAPLSPLLVAQHHQKQPSGTHISEELAEALLADDDPPPLTLNEEVISEHDDEKSSSNNNDPTEPPTVPLTEVTRPKRPTEAPTQTTRPKRTTLIEEEEFGNFYAPTGLSNTDPVGATAPAHLLLQRQPSGLSPDEMATPQLPPLVGVITNTPTKQQQSSTHPLQSPSRITYTTPKSPSPPQQQQHPGRRSITLRLLEEVPSNPISSPLISSVKSVTSFNSLRRLRNLSLPGTAFTSSMTRQRSNSGGDGGAAGGLAPLDEKTPSPKINGRMHPNGSGSRRESTTDRGTITVSWYEGTTSSEMQDHVFNCVLRKLNSSSIDKKGGKRKLEDVRLLDENVAPHGEEVVLCPFLPDRSHFLLKFKTSIERPPAPPPKVNYRPPPPYASRAPDSPSAEPSPYPGQSAEPSPYPSHANLASMDANMNGINGMNGMQSQQQQNTQQMQLLNTVAALLQQQQQQQQTNGRQQSLSLNAATAAAQAASRRSNGGLPPGLPPISLMESPAELPEKEDTTSVTTLMATSNGTVTPTSSNTAAKKAGTSPTMDPIAEDSTTDQLIEQQLQQLNNLFSQRRTVSGVAGVTSSDEGDGPTEGDTMNGTTHDRRSSQLARDYHRDEKKQVIFVIANYLVLFMSLIALSAEIQSRWLPSWMNWVQQNYNEVQNCATDQDAMMECLSNGDFSGLVASFLLWATQSVAAKRIFLFGFDTPKKLWTVVYEALVTAVCWGISYLFIRRGMNANTRQSFIHKYWKDAVYGSLAGFNAAFMKAVLKNLIPQEVALEALEGGSRQLRIFQWLGTMVMGDDVG